MAEYKLQMTTGDMTYAGTFDHVYVTLIGAGGKSERTDLDNYGVDFATGTTSTYTIKTSSPLGKLLLVKVEKDPYLFLPEDEWYCSKVVVTTPEGEDILFPCHRWISNGDLVELRGGKAMKHFEEDHALLTAHREKERMSKKALYQFMINQPGLPYINPFKDISEVPAEARFSLTKAMEILYTKEKTLLQMRYEGFLKSTESWMDIEDLKSILSIKKTKIAEYCCEHWKEDEFFGYQFLNGVNPTLIKKCSELPPNFPVKEDMVKPFLENGSSLQKEMKKGNIFLCDYKMMDGLPALEYEGQSLIGTCGFGLFYLNPEEKLVPIALQLHQQPSETNPIFLPSDLETDWLLAKMFIKNADGLHHQAVSHLLSSHWLSEAFTLSTFRNFPLIHPLYKLLVPHFRYCIQINMLSREKIFAPQGILDKSTIGYTGMEELMKNSLSEMTYRSLCLPENITERGLESIPNFYYRDDGLKLWNIINSFVSAVVNHYYSSDGEVCKDTELQDWINDIFKYGFLGNRDGGFPSCFNTVEEVIKFITMLIFTVSAQHSAVNNGQFDYYSWPLNGGILLRKSPPTTKGQSSIATILETLPNKGETATMVTTTLVLSEKYTDIVLLGTYPEERYHEPALKRMIEEFQSELSRLSEEIAKRNSELELHYTYLDPAFIENSVTI